MTNKEYTGRRILEVMHEAVRYTRSVSNLVKQAWPAGAVNVLEFGAGDGAFVKLFRTAGGDVDCVEIDRDFQPTLQNLGGRLYGDIREVTSQSYDFIYSVNVLEHIPDVVGELAELKRVLRPGGVLFVFVPAFPILWTSLDTEVGHITRFTRGSLTSVLEQGGFAVCRMSYFDSLGFPAALTIGLLEKFNMFSYGSNTVDFYDNRIFPISRALDNVFRHIMGKNLVAIARTA